MKKLLLIAAVASMSAPAFASKARLTSLGNAAHLVDTQMVFTNPGYNNLMSDYATFEAGPTTTTSTTLGAEGGFVRSMGDAKYMLYMGRKSQFTTAQRAAWGFLGQENSVELQYARKGDINWGAGLNFSSSDKKSAGQKQSAQGIRFGATTDLWNAYAIVGLGSEATGATAVAANAGTATPAITADADAKYKGLTGMILGGAYKMENLYIYGQYSTDGAKFESAVAGNANLNNSEAKATNTVVGIVDHNKLEGGQWFYGVAYSMTEQKRTGGAAAIDAKSSTTTLPFLLGLEYDATSWLTLRSSVTQNVLLGSTKTEVGAAAGETDTVANNTTVAVGAGMKFNKWVIDGSLTNAATTGDLNTTSLLANMALTYSF